MIKNGDLPPIMGMFLRNCPDESCHDLLVVTADISWPIKKPPQGADRLPATGSKHPAELGRTCGTMAVDT